ncbi:hypothetical protein [Sphingopyxis flava]|uniref:Uncharacterized protein n=1 Tax=Sphingopyxis flava TaxID=1507287 RepID=A0A1T5CV91_9SPHN|nr:hypothetical protein [Sphingopyxis flava]SKB63263.1 hypothetical protein SAMN06295937_1011141 [Sphingopyxis flava]
MNITPEMFRAYVNRIDDDELADFIDAINGEIKLLEQDDFFGTEGFEKRFA